MIDKKHLGKIFFNGPHWLLSKIAPYMHNVLETIRSIDKTCIYLFNPRKDFGIATDDTIIESLPFNVSQSRLHLTLLPYLYALKYVANHSVLEIGCNWGYGANLFSDTAHSVTAFDISADAINHARKQFKNSNLTFFVHDANDPFPLKDASYDVVFANEVIEHIHNYTGCIREAARVLKPNGLLLMKTPNAKFDRYGHKLNKWHLKVFTPTEYRLLLSTYFDEVEVYGYDEVFSYETNKEDIDVDITKYSFGEPVPLSRNIVITGFVTLHLSNAFKEFPKYLLAIAKKRGKT